MEERSWHGSGAPYTLWSGGSRWLLQFDAGCPGLRVADRPADHVLALEGVAAAGRFDSEALSQRSLSGVERVGQRVEARFAPADWGGLQVVASWSPAPVADGIDLEIEVVASSVGELKSVEVIVSTQIEGPETSKTEPSRLWVQPRDARSAGLSYDGREPASVLGRLTTGPVPVTMEPALSEVVTYGPRVGSESQYLELAHPRDVARRVIEGGAPAGSFTGRGLSVRYCLFGHDLEKGVIVRGRLRGIWISHRDAEELARSAFQQFIEAPPHLGR